MTKIPAPMQWGIEHMDSLDEILLQPAGDTLAVRALRLAPRNGRNASSIHTIQSHTKL